MVPNGQALSLGALFHELRGGLADRGHSRVFIEFRSESTTSPLSTASGSPLAVRRGFRAELDHRDEVLERAHLVSTGMSPRPLAEIWITRQDDRYLYSLDAVRHGLLRDTPRLFDVYSFESQLNRVAVRRLTEEPDPQPDGSAGRILRLDLEPTAFDPLIRLFGDDPAGMSERLDAEGCSAMLTSGTTIGVHYRWQTSGEEVVGDPDGSPERYATRHRSRVTVQLSPRREGAPPVAVAPELPVLAGLDDVWSAIRAARA